MVLDKLIQAGFAVRCDKMWLAMQSVPYLGFQVSADGTRPLKEKTKALLDMACSDMGTDPSAAARYAGMIGFYHRFIPDLHSTLQPFHELKAKGADAKAIMTSCRFMAAFEVTKQQLANVTALTRPDYSKPFILDVDAASSVGAGAILSQYADPSDTDSLRPIAWWSRRFSGEERRYGVRDQECMALVEALETWRQYVVGSRTIVRTDHRSLEWLLTTNHRDGTRVSGFALKAQGYDIEIQYVPGSLHTGADCMSRGIPPSPAGSTGGEERGVLPPFRAPIDDRIHDAIASLNIACAAIATSPQPLADTTATADTHGSTSCTDATAVTLGTSPTAFTGFYDATDTAACLPRTMVRASAMFVRHGPGGWELLTERQDGIPSIPCVDPVDQHSPARSQLCEHLALCYDDPELPRLLRKPTKRRTRWEGGRSVFFIVTLPSSYSRPRPRNHTVTTRFELINEQLESSLGALDRQLHGSLRRLLPTLHTSHALAATATVNEDDTVYPPVQSISECPFGPALIVSADDGATAGQRLTERLYKHPGLCIAIDLEGHRLGQWGRTSLIQVAVDAIDSDEQQLVYVFDAHANGQNLVGPRCHDDSLRRIIEDEHIPKVFHCCYGDVGALFHEYGIRAANVFDTGVADSVVLARHGNKPRGLGRALTHWLGTDVVQLRVKGQLVHEDYMWERRPLDPRHFVYAYEDVTYLGMLHRRLRSVCASIGLLELVSLLSQQRAPPIALPPLHRLYQPPLHLAIAVIDLTGHVICLQDKQSGSCMLPSSRLSNPRATAAEAKTEARLAWASLMGAPPKALRAAVNARLRKAVRLGDTLLYVTLVNDCAATMGALADAALAAPNWDDSCRIVLRRRLTPSGPLTDAVDSQTCLFQYLFMEASRAELAVAAVSHCAPVGPEPGCYHVDVACRPTAGGRVTLRLSTALRPDPALPRRQATTRVAAAASKPSAAAAQLLEPTRVATLLHDSRWLYVIVGKNGLPALPSHSVEQGSSHADTAAMAFDTYAGVSLRKAPGVNSHRGQLVMPRASAFVRAAERNSHCLGQHGNTVYHSWALAGHDGLFLHDHVPSFHASRRMVNGFQLNPSKRDVTPHFALMPLDLAIALLQAAAPGGGASVQCDLNALLAARQHVPAPQHSEAATHLTYSQNGQRYPDQYVTDVFAPRSLVTHSESYLPQNPVLPVRPSVSLLTSVAGRIRRHAAASIGLAATRALAKWVDWYAQRRLQRAAAAGPLSLSALAASACSVPPPPAQHSEHPPFFVKWAAQETSSDTYPSSSSDESTDHAPALAYAISVDGSRVVADVACMSGDAVDASVSVEPVAPTRRLDAELDAPPTVFPSFGDDPEFDALFTSAVACLAARYAQSASVTAPALASATKPPILTRERVLEEQLSHPGTAQYIDYLKADGLDADRATDLAEEAAHMRLADDGLLMWRGTKGARDRIVLPPRAQRDVLTLYHDFNAHLGINKILPVIKRRFYWGDDNAMRKSISEHIRTCEPCRRVKLPQHVAGEARILDNGDHPHDILSGDVFDVGIVFEEYSHTLDFVCHFSRRVSSTPVQGMPSSEEIADVVINSIIRQHGTPREIRSDRGSNFISKAMAQLYKRLGIHINAGTAYSHHLVALVERWHHTLKQLIRVQKASGADDNWPSRLPLLELAYNSAVNASTGYSPFYIDHLRHASLPWDALLHTDNVAPAHSDDKLPDWVQTTLENARVVYDASVQGLRLNALYAKRRYDLRHDVAIAFKPGDRVLLIRGEVLDHKPYPKAEAPTEGPFTIEQRLPNDRYLLTDLHNRRIHSVVHVSRVIPFPDRPADASDWMVSDPDTGGQWPVNCVLGRRLNDDKVLEYKVRWSGFTKTYDTWLPRRHLDSIAHLISHYEEQHGLAAPSPRSPRLADAPTPPAADHAVTRARFRYRAHPPAAPPATSLDTVVEEPPDLSQPLPPDPPPPPPGALPDTSNRFPVGTRVDYRHTATAPWRTGHVVTTRVTRPRAAGVLPERRIVVRCDDPAHRGKTLELGLDSSVVQQHLDATDTADATASDARSIRRLRRIELLKLRGP